MKWVTKQSSSQQRIYRDCKNSQNLQNLNDCRIVEKFSELNFRTSLYRKKILAQQSQRFKILSS